MFEEKVGIITGGTSGIGLATAELLAKEGMHVVIASRNSEKGEEALSVLRKWSPHSLFIKTDVTSRLGRIGDPLEATKAVKWLLSDDASFVTAQNIIVDGGIGFRFE